MSARATLELRGQRITGVTIEEAYRVIGDLRLFIAAHEPWHPYSEHTTQRGRIYRCCQCDETTAYPGDSGWRWRHVHGKGRGRYTESICPACVGKEQAAA